MGLFNDNKENEQKKGKNVIKSTVKKAAIGGILSFLTSKVAVLLAVVLSATIFFQFSFEIKAAEETPKEIYKQLGVEDIKELVEIVGSENDGYHLEYVDDIDAKIQQIINVLGSKSGVYTISSKDSDIIKKMIKAEVITQFPNLAGEYNEDNGEFQGAVKIRRVTPDQDIPNVEMKNTGTEEVTTLGDSEQDVVIKEENIPTAQPNNSGTEIIGDENKVYVLAIAAGHNNTDDKGVTATEEFVEEEMTIKVAEKVEELCKKYKNLIVVQTGSTSENPGGVTKEERVTLAKEANPNLCVQIHFNTGGESGVETYYEFGDGYSSTLAEILSDKMSSKMQLQNRGSKTNNNNSDYYETIDSYFQTNFPSVITQGGFIDNTTDQEALRNGGIDKYAEAIVEGCIQYLTADHSDESVTFVQNATEASGIKSRVYDLRYVPQSKFEELVEADSEEALEVFTLDEETFDVLTATWSASGNTPDITTNSPFNLRSTLQNVTMPYEYLLYFLIDSGNKDFVRDLADLVADTEIIMAVQDNITTTEITAEVEQRTKASVDEKTTEWEKNTTRSQEESSFNETVRTSISITYADTWFVRYSREGERYSSDSLGVQKDELADKTVNVSGNVTEQTSSEEKGYGAEGPYTVGEVQTGTDQVRVSVEEVNNTVSNKVTSRARVDVLNNENSDQTSNTDSNDVAEEEGSDDASTTQEYELKTIEYTYVTEERYKKTIHTISNSYEDGESVVEEFINEFVNLYNKYKMANAVKEEWLFKILAANTKTANMVDLTKYLMYMATGTSYGKEEFDFSEYDLSSFSGMSGIYGGTIQEKVWFALRSAGFSEIATAGAMGNIQAESGFNAGSIEEGTGIGIGICQWSFGRRTQLEQYAASKGVDWTDENTQIEFLLAELTGGGANGYADDQLVTYNGYSPNDWINAEDIDTATKAFCWTFERPGIPHMERRIESAKKYYEEFKGRTAPSGDSRIGTITLSADNASKMMAMLTEALRIADDNRYTYSQANRYGEYQYDCSSLVSRLYKEYFDFNAPSTTREYGSAYHIGKEGSVELQPGDVLWKQGHVEIYIGNGLVVGAHTDECAIPDQISVESYTKGYFTDVYRFIQ